MTRRGEGSGREGDGLPLPQLQIRDRKDKSLV